MNMSELSSDGKFILLKFQLELGHWNSARESTGLLRQSDVEEVPVLHHLMAISYLLGTVHPVYRSAILSSVPFNARVVPLDSDAAAIEARRSARVHFTESAKTLQQLNCRCAAAELEAYALWLELRDPESSKRGMQRLVGRLDDQEFPLHLVSLGLQYGVQMDLEEVEHEIQRQATPQGEITLDGALACFAIARMQGKPENVANYIARHHDSLALHLDTKVLRSFQIEMFAKAGLTERARRCLKLLSREGLSDVEIRRLSIVIEEGEGKDTLEAQETLYQQTGSPIDLEALANELEARQEWDKLCEYAEVLYEETHSVRDAERLANSLHLAGRSSQAVQLLESSLDLLSQSMNLQLCYCWSLYHEGELLRARCELAKVEADWETEGYRALQISLAVSVGDWDSLTVFVAREYQARQKRSARELIKAAQLALNVGSPYAKLLALEAAARESDDARVLASVHFLATKAGWESEPQFVRCLHRAVELSGDDGPFLEFTIQDILERKPEWDRQESSAMEVLNRGEVPMVLAGLFLNKSLINFILFPSLVNSGARDLRRKVGIPAVSGQRLPARLETLGTVGLDFTTLLTLSFLDLLDRVIDAFDTIYVPHSALAWLFDERQSASFHQPSRIRDARRVLELLTARSLEEVLPSATSDRALADYVGDDLATLVAEAENTNRGENQRLVVRPFPVPVAGSLGEEEADLSKYSAVLSSCQALVRKLYDMGEITEGEEKDALAYLQLQEKPWPNQPEIDSGAILYLDDLAVYYLLHSKVLDKLIEAEFRVVVSSNLISESNALIGYEGIADQVIGTIEKIRLVVSQGIDSGQVKAGKWRSVETWDEQTVADRLIADVLILAEHCDAIIADDRFLNQHPHVESNDSQVPLYTTLDLLDALESSESLKREVRMEKRTKLRRAGYLFVPVGEDELTSLLNAADVKDGEVKENIHLRSIRESILHVRMNEWLQLPREGFWLDGFFEVFLNVLRNLWRGGADVPSAEARSDWILELIDVHGWAHCFEREGRDKAIEAGRLRVIARLLIPLDANVPPNIREAYWEWLEDRVLVPIKELESGLYSLIVDFERRKISTMSDTDLTGVGDNDR